MCHRLGYLQKAMRLSNYKNLNLQPFVLFVPPYICSREVTWHSVAQLPDIPVQLLSFLVLINSYARPDTLRYALKLGLPLPTGFPLTECWGLFLSYNFQQQVLNSHLFLLALGEGEFCSWCLGWLWVTYCIINLSFTFGSWLQEFQPLVTCSHCLGPVAAQPTLVGGMTGGCSYTAARKQGVGGMKSKGSFKGLSLMTSSTWAAPLTNSQTSNGATAWWSSLLHRDFGDIPLPSYGTYCLLKCLAQLLLICMSTSAIHRSPVLFHLPSGMCWAPFFFLCKSYLQRLLATESFLTIKLVERRDCGEMRFGYYVSNSLSSDSQGHLRD